MLSALERLFGYCLAVVSCESHEHILSFRLFHCFPFRKPSFKAVISHWFIIFWMPVKQKKYLNKTFDPPKFSPGRKSGKQSETKRGKIWKERKSELNPVKKHSLGISPQPIPKKHCSQVMEWMKWSLTLEETEKKSLKLEMKKEETW